MRAGDVQVRFARRADTALILDFIRQLALYENLAHEVVADEALTRLAERAP